MLIAVSGNVGSGKTTLANFLAEHYDLSFVPNKRLEFGFLDAFFDNVERNFLPTQLSFLISKANEMEELLHAKKSIVVDRSILEDIGVFARLWIENRDIDEKIVNLYSSTASFIRHALPEPDLYIFCRCPANVSRQRIANRAPRKYESKYPPNHIELLEQYYNELIDLLETPCVEIDTTQYDFTAEGVMSSLCTLIFSRLEQERNFGQLSFFDNPTSTENEWQGLIFHNIDRGGFQKIPELRKKKNEYIYLAAPFTQMAPLASKDIDENTDEKNLFSNLRDIPSYGTLDASYQKKLEKIERAIIKYFQVPVYLPHRDINNWGKTKHPTEYLTPIMISTVEQATAVVAIPGSSIGVHLELGIAIARRIPIIIFDTAEFSGSFFVEGFKELPFIKYIKVPSLSHIPACIKTINIKDFISKS